MASELTLGSELLGINALIYINIESLTQTVRDTYSR